MPCSAQRSPRTRQSRTSSAQQAPSFWERRTWPSGPDAAQRESHLSTCDIDPDFPLVSTPMAGQHMAGRFMEHTTLFRNQADLAAGVQSLLASVFLWSHWEPRSVRAQKTTHASSNTHLDRQLHLGTELPERRCGNQAVPWFDLEASRHLLVVPSGHRWAE